MCRDGGLFTGLVHYTNTNQALQQAHAIKAECILFHVTLFAVLGPIRAIARSPALHSASSAVLLFKTMASASAVLMLPESTSVLVALQCME